MKESIYKQLSAPIDKEFLREFEHSSGVVLQSIQAQYIRMRLNEVLGLGSWRLVHRVEVLNDYVLCRGYLVYKVEGTDFRTTRYYGGAKIQHLDVIADYYKSAITDCLSKCASEMGVGNEVFLGSSGVAPDTFSPPSQTKKEVSKGRDMVAKAVADPSGGGIVLDSVRHREVLAPVTDDALDLSTMDTSSALDLLKAGLGGGIAPPPKTRAEQEEDKLKVSPQQQVVAVDAYVVETEYGPVVNHKIIKWEYFNVEVFKNIESVDALKSYLKVNLNLDWSVLSRKLGKSRIHFDAAINCLKLIYDEFQRNGKVILPGYKAGVMGAHTQNEKKNVIAAVEKAADLFQAPDPVEKSDLAPTLDASLGIPSSAPNVLLDISEERAARVEQDAVRTLANSGKTFHEIYDLRKSIENLPEAIGVLVGTAKLIVRDRITMLVAQEMGHEIVPLSKTATPVGREFPLVPEEAFPASDSVEQAPSEDVPAEAADVPAPLEVAESVTNAPVKTYDIAPLPSHVVNCAPLSQQRALADAQGAYKQFMAEGLTNPFFRYYQEQYKLENLTVICKTFPDDALIDLLKHWKRNKVAIENSLIDN